MVHVAVAIMKLVWSRSIGWNIQLHGYKKKKMDYYVITDGADCYPWHEYFAILPRNTVGGTRIFWEKAYKRKVWVVWGTGFHMEPETQHATLFELLTYDDKNTFTK
jgi:hypothetical protein